MRGVARLGRYWVERIYGWVWAIHDVNKYLGTSDAQETSCAVHWFFEILPGTEPHILMLL